MTLVFGQFCARLLADPVILQFPAKKEYDGDQFESPKWTRSAVLIWISAGNIFLILDYLYFKYR